MLDWGERHPKESIVMVGRALNWELGASGFWAKLRRRAALWPWIVISVSAHSFANFDLEKYVPFGTRLASPKIKAIYSFHQIFRARVHSGLTVCAADR